MWVKVDDRLPRHPKMLEAGRQLGGRHSRARTLALYIDVLAYCAAYLTDGFLSEAAIEDITIDPEPRDVLNVLAGVGLVHKLEGGGYQVHDFEDYNPTAVDVKAKRAKDRERKRQRRLELAAERALKEAQGSLPLDVLADSGADVRAESSRTDADASEGCPPRSRARDPVPSRPLKDQNQNHRRGRAGLCAVENTTSERRLAAYAHAEFLQPLKMRGHQLPDEEMLATMLRQAVPPDLATELSEGLTRDAARRALRRWTGRARSQAR